MLSVNGADHLKAEVHVSTENKYNFIKGLGSYVYGGEYGSLVKVKILKNEKSTFGGNWGLIVDFDAVLQAMEEQQANTATLYIFDTRICL